MILIDSKINNELSQRRRLNKNYSNEFNYNRNSLRDNNHRITPPNYNFLFEWILNFLLI